MERARSALDAFALGVQKAVDLTVCSKHYDQGYACARQEYVARGDTINKLALGQLVYLVMIVSEREARLVI